MSEKLKPTIEEIHCIECEHVTVKVEKDGTYNMDCKINGECDLGSK
jgi:hypothetical protein